MHRSIERLFHGTAVQCPNGCGHIEREPDPTDYDFTNPEDQKDWEADWRLFHRRWQRHMLRCVRGRYADHFFRRERAEDDSGLAKRGA